MITTVVFDLDDTLYDEIEYCKSGFAAVAKFLSNLPDKPPFERIFDAFWTEFIGGERTKTFNVSLEKLGISNDDKHITKLVEVYRRHKPKITLPADSRGVLDELIKRYTLALLTDGFLPAQQLKVQALGIEKYFKCIIFTEEIGRQFWKPSPAGFEKILQILNVRAENTAYIADNEEKDFIAPNNLGILTIQLIRPAAIHTSHIKQSGAAAHFVIHQISSLPAILEKN
jgi:putative hydrolase of the HAD superfamily